MSVEEERERERGRSKPSPLRNEELFIREPLELFSLSAPQSHLIFPGSWGTAAQLWRGLSLCVLNPQLQRWKPVRRACVCVCICRCHLHFVFSQVLPGVLWRWWSSVERVDLPWCESIRWSWLKDHIRCWNPYSVRFLLKTRSETLIVFEIKYIFAYIFWV